MRKKEYDVLGFSVPADIGESIYGIMCSQGGRNLSVILGDAERTAQVNASRLIPRSDQSIEAFEREKLLNCALAHVYGKMARLEESLKEQK